MSSQEGLPLAGKRILITRSRQQASELAARLEELGAETVLIPAIELAPPGSYCALDAALASVRSFDWVLFTSANAVEAFAERARWIGVLPSPRKIAVVGPATRKAVEGLGLAVDLMPPQFVAESLAEALLPFAPGASMLLVRAETARDVLPEMLTAAGAQMTIAAAYRTVLPPGSVTTLQRALGGTERLPDAVTFTSSSTATNLLALLDAAGLRLPETVVRASIGPITSRTLVDAGYPAHVEAKEATIASLCEALVGHLRSDCS